MTITFDRSGTNGFVSLDSYCAENEVLRPRSSNAVSLEWKNIKYEVPVGKCKKVLINHMYGRCAPGTLTAIMGPSGAGKTTLMNILSGHIEKGYEGEVQVNGCVRDTKLFNMQSCYVMQDDCLLPELTVREALSMSVQLRTPSVGSSIRREIVDDAVHRWGLTECQNTRASYLSGGQRKRLAISQELISNPPVIFLDEPTSGLDSSSALRCVLVLRSLAACGHTVLCSIHNPSATLFSHFDKEKQHERNLYKINASAFLQFGVLLKRCFLCQIRNRVASQLRLIAYLFFSALLTMMYYGIGNRATRVMNNAAMFLVALAIILFQSIMPTVLIFPTELSVLLREHRNCWYSPSMYYVARIITELPFTIGGPLVMMCILHWSTAQPFDFHRVAAVVLLAVQTCATSQAIALVVSAASSMQTALFVALPAAAPSFLFCGYFVQVRHLHQAFAWITYTSHVYHAHQGMLYAIYGHGREELDCDDDSFCFLSDPREILAKLDAEHAYLSVKFAILLGMDLLLKIIAFFVLKWRLRRKR